MKKRIGIILGWIYVGLVLIGDFLLFFSAVSVLWGWWFIGVVSFLVLFARAIDDRENLRKIILRRTVFRPWERVNAIGYVVLVGIALVINVGFFLAYFLGVGVPYDPDPMRPPSATIIYQHQSESKGIEGARLEMFSKNDT